jgi:nucleotide-binding universal stress UspA family protein
MERVPPYAVSYLPSDYLALTRDSIQADLDKLAAEVSNGAGVVITGHSGRSILDWAEDNPVDLIVIASHRPGMQDLLLGSTAAKVVRHAQCAVHVIR